MLTPNFQIPNRKPDWQDTHIAIGATRFASAKEAYFASLDGFPKWVKYAMRLRNWVVRPFGLKTEVDMPIEGGNLLAYLPAIHDNPNSYEAGIDDKHLTFTIETSLIGDEIHFTTKIWFNHPLGKLYLAIVYVPHKIILRSATTRLAKAHI